MEVSTPVVTRVEQSTVAKHKIRKNMHKHVISTTAPAHNTRSRTQQAETTPSRRTRACTWIAIMANKKQTGRASAVETTIPQLENDVHQVLAVMDADTGNLLNYRQLMKDLKYKKNWSTSSANEFGRLANGSGKQIKNITNKITFIRRKAIPNNFNKDVTYRKFVFSMRPEKK